MTLEDLMNVKGIGQKKFDALKGLICLWMASWFYFCSFIFHWMVQCILNAFYGLFGADMLLLRDKKEVDDALRKVIKKLGR